MESLVSIIVPIYNVEQYLEKCIQSIRSQSYRNIEIILVNDGSKDNSVEIINKYEMLDNRIIVVSQKNTGLVGARKAGIKKATGEFVCWVDADDWIESNHVENLVRIQQTTKADVVAASLFHDIGSDSTIIKNGIPVGEYSGKDIISKMLYTGCFYEYGVNPHLVTKLFRTELVKQYQMAVDNRIITGEDAAVVYACLYKANRIAISDIATYHYVQRQGSITKITYDNERENIRVLINYLERIFENEDIHDEIRCQLKMYEKYLWVLRDISVFDKKDETNILMPFGNIEKGKRIIIYGAGVVGQRIASYLKKRREVQIVGWVDRNYKKYQILEYEVTSPNELPQNYDYIVIANISEKIYGNIRETLLSQGVPKEKIRWFTDEFIGKV